MMMMMMMSITKTIEIVSQAVGWSDTSFDSRRVSLVPVNSSYYRYAPMTDTNEVNRVLGRR